MTDDLIARAKACPDISHARIVAPEDRVPEVVMPTATRDALCARIATQQDAIDELVAHIREQSTHCQTRIQDGIEMGATVWRLALEDVARENAALLSKHGQRT